MKNRIGLYGIRMTFEGQGRRPQPDGAVLIAEDSLDETVFNKSCCRYLFLFKSVAAILATPPLCRD